MGADELMGGQRPRKVTNLHIDDLVHPYSTET